VPRPYGIDISAGHPNQQQTLTVHHVHTSSNWLVSLTPSARQRSCRTTACPAAPSQSAAAHVKFKLHFLARGIRFSGLR